MDWLPVAVFGGSFLGLSVVGYFFYKISYKAGRSDAQKETAEKGANVKQKQIEAAVSRPDALDRLRDGRF